MDDDVALGYTSSLTITYPVETEDGDVIITVSDLDRKACKESRFPAELMAMYRQSPEHKDRMEELHDACTSLSIFETAESDIESKWRALRGHAPLTVEKAVEILQSPVEALRVSQLWTTEKDKRTSIFSREFRQKFYDELIVLVPRETVEAWNRSVLVTHLRAVEVFLETLFELLEQWKSVEMNIHSWHYFFPGALYRFHRAQEAVHQEYSVTLNDDSTVVRAFPWEGGQGHQRAGGDSRDDRYQRFLKGRIALVGQRSIYDASRNVALLVFRQILIQKTELSFCEWCDRVFEVGKKTKFCSGDCARDKSSCDAKRKSVANENFAKIEKAIQILGQWLSSPSIRGRYKWRQYLEQELRRCFVITGSTTGRALRFVAQWIKAAHTPKDSDERINIIELCMHHRSSLHEQFCIEESVSHLLTLILQAEG